MSDEQPMSRRAAREAAGAASRRRPDRRSARTSLEADSDTPDRPGLGGFFAKHRTAWLGGALGVVFVLLGTSAVFAGVAVGSAPDPVAAPTDEAIPERDLPEGELVPTRLRTCSVRSLARDSRLSQLFAHVVVADTGEVLFARRADDPARTASVLKLFTAAAALEVLGPNYQITTSVLTASTPGSIVLVGRGDATLSALPAGQESVYRGAPKLDDLAAQTLAQYSGDPITNIVLDASYWPSSDKWDPTWARSEQTIGYQSEVTALQVDGDRADPKQSTSPRSTDPITRAGVKFLAALRALDTEGKVAADVTFTVGTESGGSTLASVKSRPLSELVEYMLLVSDNTLAEMLARITSKESALNGSSASLDQAIPSALQAGYGISGADLTIIDGSGLSAKNAVPPTAITQLFVQMRADVGHLDVVRAGLPVAGESGTLASRFTGGNAVARGQVFAKTGWIDTAYTLAGLIRADDGTVLAFSFYAIRNGIESSARDALDSLATGVYKCGDNLSNN